MRMYCIISKVSLSRMRGIRGKMMGQAGHAFLHAYWDSEKRFPVEAYDYQDTESAVKVVVVVDTDADMLALEKKYRDVCGTTVVTDAGRTVFEAPTLTCVGIGPLKDGAVGDDLKNLKLLT